MKTHWNIVANDLQKFQDMQKHSAANNLMKYQDMQEHSDH